MQFFLNATKQQNLKKVLNYRKVYYFFQCENASFDMAVDISGNHEVVFKPCECPAKSGDIFRSQSNIFDVTFCKNNEFNCAYKITVF